MSPGGPPQLRLETEGWLRRFWGPKANALHFEHAHLRFRAAGRREAANLAARGQHPVAGNDQRGRILGHRLADSARRFAARADLLRQRAVGGGAAPTDSAQSVRYPSKERVRGPARSSAEPARNRFPRRQKYSFAASTTAATASGGGAWLRAKVARRRTNRSVTTALFVGN